MGRGARFPPWVGTAALTARRMDVAAKAQLDFLCGSLGRAGLPRLAWALAASGRQRARARATGGLQRLCAPPPASPGRRTAALRGDMSTKFALPVSDEPIHVYLFDSPARYQTFMALHHPELPSRRAFFFESDTRLEVYAHWGDRVAEDLRHE